MYTLGSPNLPRQSNLCTWLVQNPRALVDLHFVHWRPSWRNSAAISMVWSSRPMKNYWGATVVTHRQIFQRKVNLHMLTSKSHLDSWVDGESRKINFSLSIGGHWWLFANWWLSSKEETVPRTKCLIIKCYLQIEEQNFRNGLGRFSTHSCSSGFCPWYALATLPPESPSGFRSTFFANCARVCGFLFCALTIFDLEENTMNDAYYGIDHKWQSRFETGFRGCEYVISEDTCQTCRLHRNILTPIADACRVVDL